MPKILAMLLASSAVILAASSVALAQQVPSAELIPPPPATLSQDAMRAIPPMPLPQADPALLDEEPLEPAAHSRIRVQGAPAQPPVDPEPLVLPDHIDELLSEDAEPMAAPAASNRSGHRWTTSRVFPVSALTAFPYSTIGKVTATFPGGRTGHCSGSTIQLRLVLTAGHCVYDAERRIWAGTITFKPMYTFGSSPAGVWIGTHLFTTNQWIRSRAQVPTHGDFGIFSVGDRVVNGRVQALGNVTGWLGWQTGAFREHFNQVGYPGNLDHGEFPQMTTALVSGGTANHYRWGTNQSAGSSGSPLVMNWGVNGAGQNYFNNRVVGVISCGFRGRDIQCSSTPRNNFANLFRGACRAAAGNCR